MARWSLWLLLAAGGCAVAPTGQRTEPLIGGTPTAPGAFPATGALWIAFGDLPPSPTCAATLLAPDVAVTAAHCFLDAATTPAELVIADDAGDMTAPRVEARAVHLHPQFTTQPGADGSAHDVALVLLAHAIDGVTPEVAATVDDRALVGSGAPLDVVAFGPTRIDGAGNRKNEAQLRITSGDDSELVAGSDGDTACIGDSGGAGFVTRADGSRRLAALVSRAADANAPCSGATRLTRLDAYADWLQAGLTAPGGCDVGHGARPSPLWWAPLVLLLARRRRARASSINSAASVTSPADEP